ncbi:MAG: family 16 glycoside hydrolase, partial [Planctomycetota bacterium]
DMETTGVAALSPDGTYLARTSKPRSGGYHVAPLDGQDKNRWAEWSRIRPNNAMVCLAWGKSDRPLIASGDPHGAVVSRGSGILEYGYKGQTSTIHAVAFSPDGTRLASGSSDKSVWLWDVAAVKTLWKRQPLGCYDGLAFTPDGKTLACGGYADTLHLLDAATGETLRELSGHEGRIRGLAVSPDGSMLAGASEDHTVRLWDIATGTLRHTLAGHTDQVWTVAFSRDGALVASGGNDTTVRLWDARAGRPLATLTDHTAKVRTVAFSSSADVLVTVGQESIRVWDLLPPGTKPTPPQPTPREPRRPLPPPDADGWCGLLDGTSLDGWEPVEAFPGTDAAGPVAVEEGSVVLGQGWPWTGAVWTGAVPSVDYEFEIEGQRVKGTGDFCSVVFPVKDQFCKLNVGGHWPYVIALDTIDGRTGRDGRNPARREASFEDGRWYRVRARVTAERVEAWLDGEQVINLPLDPHELTLFDQYPSMAALKPFGVCTWKTKGAIRNLRLRRLKPDGTPIAPPKPPTPEPPASDYATKSEQVWGLLAERKYTDAQALLAKLAADPAYQGNAALAADRQAATLLAEFWDRVETKLAQMKGRYTRVGDAVGQVMGVADGVVTLKTAKGRVRSPVRELTARQALGFAGLGDEPRDRLLLGTFLLAEGDDPKGADAALAAAGDSPAVAHYRQRLASALDTPKPTPPKPPQGKPKPGQWQSLFDGESLGQWKPVVPDDAPQKARVSVRDGAIVIEGDTYDKGIAWTGDFPSDSYEVAMETMRAAGPTKRVNHEFCDIVFPVGDTTCVLLVGAGGEEADLVALKNVDGKRTEQPPLAGRVPTVEGRWYRIGLRVTPASVRVWVDGKPIIQLPRDRHQLDVQWRHDYLPFGIQAGVKRTLLRNLRVRRLPSGPVKPVEKPGQWRPLFNGKDLSGWTGDTEAWAVERGTLTARGGNKGYLWAEGDYGDFVLELDFRLPKGGNSGIFLRTANPRDPVKTGLEVQLVDPTGQKLEPRYTSGALYGCHAPSRDATRPAGEWNHITVACKGSRIAVEINDRRVNALDLRRWTQRGRNPQGGSTPQPHALKDHPRTGRLGLQNWGTRAWFRNLRIRPLD